MASRSNRDQGSRKSKLFIGISTVVFVAGLAATAWSVEGIRNVVFQSGGTLAKTPDASSGPVDLGFSANFFGPTPYSQIYVNENGNVTFTAPNPNADPSTFDIGTDGPMIAPFFTDIDTTPPESGQVEFGQAIVDGKQAFVVNWPNVSLGGGTPGSNTFQLVLTQETDGSLGVEFNYGSLVGVGGSAAGPLIGLFPGPQEGDETPVEPVVIALPNDPVDPLILPPGEECTPESTALECLPPPTFVIPPEEDEIIVAGGPLPEGPLPDPDPQQLPPEDELPQQIVSNDQVTDAPEPATLLLLGAGLAGLGVLRRRRRAA